MAVEVMWTPEADNDFYTRDEMFSDYPTLNTLWLPHWKTSSHLQMVHGFIEARIQGHCVIEWALVVLCVGCVICCAVCCVVCCAVFLNNAQWRFKSSGWRHKSFACSTFTVNWKMELRGLDLKEVLARTATHAGFPYERLGPWDGGMVLVSYCTFVRPRLSCNGDRSVAITRYTWWNIVERNVFASAELILTTVFKRCLRCWLLWFDWILSEFVSLVNLCR